MSSPQTAGGCYPAVSTADPTASTPVERTRFRNLVQSPLRAALLRHLQARRGETFEIETLAQIFARLRADVENCVRELVAHGFLRRTLEAPPRFTAAVPDDPAQRRLLEEFLASPAAVTPEDRSPALRRMRDLIGVDEKMLLVLESIRTVAKTDISTLVLGPTGAGKEVAARVIHELSRRSEHTFQAVSCAALPDSLFESEIFGYEKGAFTGASDRKPGRMEMANRGTLFLDELGDLSLLAQAKLLRALEERKIERLGGRQSIEVDFRLVSATNLPLDVLVADRRFREDLYYRVNSFTIHLPSLRERPADIPILAGRFLAAYCEAQGLARDAKVFSAGALDWLSHHPWSGNIREMVATVSRSALSSRNRTIQADDVQFLHSGNGNGQDPAPAEALVPLRDVERAYIGRVLEATSWNKKAAAQLLDVSREKLYRKIRAYNLTAPRPAAADAARADR